MDLRNLMKRTNLALGLIGLAMAVWGGTHLQHLLDDLGSRHNGETVVALVLALLFFLAGRYGAARRE